MKHLLKGAILACVVTLFLSIPSPSTAEARTKPSLWRALPNRFSLNAGTLPFRSLDGVAAISANDIWAVGSFTGIHSSSLTLIEHWNGSAWSMVPSPDPGAISNGLAGIAAVSASDIWAVGSFSRINGLSQALIEHWNGNAWGVVSSPNPTGSMNSALSGIAVISARDIWAVGNSSHSSNTSQTLIEHWNGSAWSIVNSPSPGIQSSLDAVAAVAANTLWAVGSSSHSSNTSQTLIERWNGGAWSIVTSPTTGSSFVTLVDVSVVSANNIWAVGSSNRFNTTLVEHWNGSTWSIVTSPNPAPIDLLIGSAVVSSSNVWAVGQALNFNGQTLIEHWDGSAWSVVNSPNQSGSINNFLLGVAVISASDIWAVGGYQSSNNAGHTLTEHWNGNVWSIVPSP